MMNRADMRTFLLIFLALVSLVHPTALFPENRALRIGVISGLGGMAGKWNRFQNMGIQLAQEDLNREGWAITLEVEDSQSSAPRAISAFDKLVALDKVDAVIADDFGFAIAPLIPRVAQQKKLFVALSLPHARYCGESSGYFFSITSQFSMSAAAYARFFALHPEVTRIGMIVFDDQEWGLTYRNLWEQLARQFKVTIVDTLVTSEFQPDYKGFFARIMPKRVEAILIAHEPESFFKVKEQFRYGGYVVAANNVLEMLTDLAVRNELEGSYVVDPGISEEFRKKFVARFKRQPILEAYAGYEALRAVARAFAVDRQNPQLGMRKVKYDGVAGPIDFTAGSCVGNLASWGLYRFLKGEMVRQ